MFVLRGKQVVKGVEIYNSENKKLKSVLNILYAMVNKDVFVEGVHYKFVTGQKERYLFSQQAITDLAPLFAEFIKKHNPNADYNRMVRLGRTMKVPAKPKAFDTSPLIREIVDAAQGEIRAQFEKLREDLDKSLSSLQTETKTLHDKLDAIALGVDKTSPSTNSRALRFSVDFDGETEIQALTAINQCLNYLGARNSTDFYQDILPMFGLLRDRYAARTGLSSRVDHMMIKGKMRPVDIFKDAEGFSDVVLEVVELVLKKHGIATNSPKIDEDPMDYDCGYEDESPYYDEEEH